MPCALACRAMSVLEAMGNFAILRAAKASHWVTEKHPLHSDAPVPVRKPCVKMTDQVRIMLLTWRH